MGAIERFEAEFPGASPLHQCLRFSDAGLVLGAGIVIAPLRRGAANEKRNPALDFSGEDRMLALFTAAFMAPVDAALLAKLCRAGEFWECGEKALAQIYLMQLRLPPLGETQALRLHLADRLMASGYSPHELCKQLGFELPAGLRKFDPDQPRDEQGRWTVGSSAAPQAVTEGRSISPGGPRNGDEIEDELDAERRALGEETPEEDQRHGRPIDPLGPTPMPFGGTRSGAAPGALPSKTELLGNNPEPAGSRWNTDLPGGRAEAEALFERLTAGRQVCELRIGLVI